MEFITSQDMENFKKLGYTFTSEYTPNNIGSTYHVIVTDSEGKEVVHTRSSYGNMSGHGYAKSFAQSEAVEKLKAYIENPNPEKVEDNLDYDFLYNLINWDYISDYGFDKDGDFMILFDTWSQLEGREDRDGNMHPSVFGKLLELNKKGLLKPSVAYTLDNMNTGFTDQFRKCDRCGKIVDVEWEGLKWVEQVGEELCHDCINESEDVIEALIDEAKDDFHKALPVDISEDIIKELGYEELDTEKNFSTRMAQWGESSWGCHDTNPSILEELCKKYDSFPKLTWVGQFDAEYQIYVPSDRISEARAEIGIAG